jgi:hypothetical protein
MQKGREGQSGIHGSLLAIFEIPDSKPNFSQSVVPWSKTWICGRSFVEIVG